MKTAIALLNTAMIIGGIVAAKSGEWPAAIGLWVFVIADRLDEIACAARAAGREHD